MANRLKYCERWRPCSDTSTHSSASTASSRWSDNPDTGQIWTGKVKFYSC